MRKTASTVFKHWPLLISRSPVSYSTGLILADDAMRKDILSAFAGAALDFGKKQGVSFILFDYLSKANSQDWPGSFSVMTTSDPGTYMENSWDSMDDYLASGNKKDRQHYKRVLRESEKLGIKIQRQRHIENMEAAMLLIRKVERRHGALPNPWVQHMLEHMELVSGSFLTANIGDQLVGCGLVLEDNASQMTSALGLADDIPFVYFMLLYESLGMAFENKVRSLRWGSGAYDVKQRLGFSFEDNSSLVFSATNPYLQKAIQWSF